MMTTTTAREELQQRIVGKIVPACTLGFEVLECAPDRVVLAAPLEKNVNDKGTAFAGSGASLATLACWCFADGVVRRWAAERGDVDVPAVVAKETSLRYRRPIRGDFCAVCTAAESAAAEFVAALDRAGRGGEEGARNPSIDLDSVVYPVCAPSEQALLCHGTFVALLQRH